MVPLKVSVAFCDGSTMPPQAAAEQQTASASAAKNLRCMAGMILPRGLGIGDWGPNPESLHGRADLFTGTIQQAESGHHQSIRLSLERGREDGVPLGVAGELLRERDEFLALHRRAAAVQLAHGSTHHRAVEPGW